jgi:hypothetical protein
MAMNPQTLVNAMTATVVAQAGETAVTEGMTQEMTNLANAIIAMVQEATIIPSTPTGLLDSTLSAVTGTTAGWTIQ